MSRKAINKRLDKLGQSRLSDDLEKVTSSNYEFKQSITDVEWFKLLAEAASDE